MLCEVEVLADDRRSKRHTVSLACEVTHLGDRESTAERIRDLSVHGVLLEAAEPWRIGEHVVVAFEPPGWSGVRLMQEARVVRHADGYGQNAWMGMEWVNASPYVRSVLQKALSLQDQDRALKDRSESHRELVDIEMV